MFLILKFFHDFFYFIINLFFRLICSLFLFILYFIWLKGFFNFSTILELNLWEESSCFHKFDIIVSAWANILVIHQPLKSDNPRPFLVAIAPTKVKFLVFCSHFETCWNHFLTFFQVTFIWSDLLKVNNISDFFTWLISKREEIIDSENHPSLTPFFQKFRAFIQWALSYLTVLQFVFECLLIHVWICQFLVINKTFWIINF